MLTADVVDDNVRTIDAMKPIVLVKGRARAEAHNTKE